MGKVNDPSFWEMFIGIIFPLAVNICWTYYSVLALNETFRIWVICPMKLPLELLSHHFIFLWTSFLLPQSLERAHTHEKMSLRTRVIFKTQSSWVNIMCFRDTCTKPFFHLHSAEQRGRFLCSWKKTQTFNTANRNSEGKYLPKESLQKCGLAMRICSDIFAVRVCFNQLLSVICFKLLIINLMYISEP